MNLGEQKESEKALCGFKHCNTSREVKGVQRVYHQKGKWRRAAQDRGMEILTFKETTIHCQVSY